MQIEMLTSRVFLLVSLLMVLGRGASGTLAAELAAPKPPYIAITAIAVNPDVLHKSQLPNSATITIEVRVRGVVASEVTATVALGTSFMQPLGNNVSYSHHGELTLPLKGNPIRFRFGVRAGRQTTTGRIEARATIVRTTGGVNVLESKRTASVWFKTLAP